MSIFSSQPLLRKANPPLIPVPDSGHLGFDYTIRLSSRKSAAIEVRAGKVLVAAPLRATQTELKQWVAAKADWIRDKLAQQCQRHLQVPQRSFTDGEPWPWLDETLTLHIDPGSKTGCRRDGQALRVTLSKRTLASDKPNALHVQKALQDWYLQQAQTLLAAKTEAVCRQLRLRYPQTRCQRVQLRRTKSKWGHCTRQGVIQYNWLVTQAPEWVVDYLVVHECCHLVHHNHSRSYWALVGSLYPNYATARRWLQEHGHTLIL